MQPFEVTLPTHAVSGGIDLYCVCDEQVLSLVPMLSDLVSQVQAENAAGGTAVGQVRSNDEEDGD